MQQVSPGTTIATSETEPKILFRADTDQHGEWYVWRKLSMHGWATMRRCHSREDALQLAETMNRDPNGTIFRG